MPKAAPRRSSPNWKVLKNKFVQTDHGWGRGGNLPRPFC
jgi:hypothetical protein